MIMSDAMVQISTSSIRIWFGHVDSVITSLGIVKTPCWDWVELYITFALEKFLGINELNETSLFLFRGDQILFFYSLFHSLRFQRPEYCAMPLQGMAYEPHAMFENQQSLRVIEWLIVFKLQPNWRLEGNNMFDGHWTRVALEPWSIISC